VIATLANGALVTVVVGHSSHVTIAPPAGSQVPKREPANVTANSDATRQALRQLQRRVPFRLEAPRLIDHSSVPDPSQPVRIYAIAEGHKAVRLTFRSGDFDYWGIEETDWTGAPALKQANDIHHFGRRELDLYYSGPHLHMVVLREQGASYWVVNSLLDALSNETMLAIARSLAPVGR
jgi:hypothetical protein